MSNVNRRHMTKGQRAMAVAMLYPDPAQAGRGKKSDALNTAESAGFSSRRLNEARTVLKWAPEKAEGVLAGASLDAAYETAAQPATRPRARRPRQAIAAAIALRRSAIGPSAPFEVVTVTTIAAAIALCRSAIRSADRVERSSALDLVPSQRRLRRSAIRSSNRPVTGQFSRVIAAAIAPLGDSFRNV